MLWILGSVCLIIPLVALLANYEATVGIGHHTDEKDERPEPKTCPYAAPPESAATKGVIFVIEGLRSDSGLTYPPNSTLGRVKLQFSQTRSTLIALATGRHDPPFLQLTGRPSSSDSVFRYPAKTVYAGPYGVPQYFTEGKWLASAAFLKISEFQSMNASNPGHLDRATVCQIKSTMAKSLNNTRLRNLFVVHLVQIQMAAKFAGIHSAMYETAVKETSVLIEDLTRFVNFLYGEKTTFFLAVSSHGTDARGKFGGGSLEEILVPIATWGKGSCTGLKVSTKVEDLCPLVAGALGFPIPSDSRGELPGQYMTPCLREEAGRAITIQTAELCLKLAEKAGALTKWFIRPGIKRCQLRAYKQADHFVSNGLYDRFPSVFYQKARQCVVNYDQSYRQSLHLGIATVYIAWIIFLCAFLAPPTNTRRFFSSGFVKIITCAIIAGKVALIVTIVYTQHWPWYVGLVLVAPILLWGATVCMTDRILAAADRLNPKEFVIYVAGTLLIVEVAYWSEYYVFTAPIFLIPYCAWTTHKNHKYVPRHVIYTWVSTTIVILILPIVMAGVSDPTTSSPALLNIGAATWIIGGCLFAYRMDLKPKEQILAAVVAAKATVAIWLVDLLALRFWDTWLAVISWFILFTPIVIFFASDALSTRLMQFCLALSPPFLLLCYRQEPFILMVLTVHLYSWLRLEASSPQYKLQGFIRAAALHFYLVFSLTAMAIPALMTSYETIFVSLFYSRDVLWLVAGLNWYKVTLVTTVVIGFWTAASMYIGSGMRTTFTYLLMVTAINAFRHFVSFTLTKSPLPLIIVAHLRFFILIPPLIAVPFIMSVPKYKEALDSRPV